MVFWWVLRYQILECTMLWMVSDGGYTIYDLSFNEVWHEMKVIGPAQFGAQGV